MGRDYIRIPSRPASVITCLASENAQDVIRGQLSRLSSKNAELHEFSPLLSPSIAPNDEDAAMFLHEFTDAATEHVAKMPCNKITTQHLLYNSEDEEGDIFTNESDILPDSLERHPELPESIQQILRQNQRQEKAASIQESTPTLLGSDIDKSYFTHMNSKGTSERNLYSLNNCFNSSTIANIVGVLKETLQSNKIKDMQLRALATELLVIKNPTTVSSCKVVGLEDDDNDSIITENNNVNYQQDLNTEQHEKPLKFNTSCRVRPNKNVVEGKLILTKDVKKKKKKKLHYNKNDPVVRDKQDINENKKQEMDTFNYYNDPYDHHQHHNNHRSSSSPNGGLKLSSCVSSKKNINTSSDETYKHAKIKSKNEEKRKQLKNIEKNHNNNSRNSSKDIQLGEEKDIVSAFHKRIHQNNNPIINNSDLKDYYASANSPQLSCISSTSTNPLLLHLKKKNNNQFSEPPSSMDCHKSQCKPHTFYNPLIPSLPSQGSSQISATNVPRTIHKVVYCPSSSQTEGNHIQNHDIQQQQQKYFTQHLSPNFIHQNKSSSVKSFIDSPLVSSSRSSPQLPNYHHYPASSVPVSQAPHILKKNVLNCQVQEGTTPKPITSSPYYNVSQTPQGTTPLLSLHMNRLQQTSTNNNKNTVQQQPFINHSIPPPQPIHYNGIRKSDTVPSVNHYQLPSTTLDSNQKLQKNNMLVASTKIPTTNTPASSIISTKQTTTNGLNVMAAQRFPYSNTNVTQNKQHIESMKPSSVELKNDSIEQKKNYVQVMNDCQKQPHQIINLGKSCNNNKSYATFQPNHQVQEYSQWKQPMTNSNESREKPVPKKRDEKPQSVHKVVSSKPHENLKERKHVKSHERPSSQSSHSKQKFNPKKLSQDHVKNLQNNDFISHQHVKDNDPSLSLKAKTFSTDSIRRSSLDALQDLSDERNNEIRLSYSESGSTLSLSSVIRTTNTRQ